MRLVFSVAVQVVAARVLMVVAASAVEVVTVVRVVAIAVVVAMVVMVIATEDIPFLAAGDKTAVVGNSGTVGQAQINQYEVMMAVGIA